MPRQFVYVVDDYHPSYLHKNVGVLLRFFQKRGYTSVIATQRQPHSSASAGPVWQLPSLKLKGLRLYWLTWRLWQTCRQPGCVVLGYAERGHAWLLLLMKYLTGATIILKTDSCLLKIMALKTALTWRQRLFIQWPLQRADRIIVESPPAVEFLTHQWRIRPAKIVLLPNGVYPAEIDQVVPVIAAKEKLVVYVGRLLPAKGADLAIKAWQKIQAQYPDWRLQIIGRAVDPSYTAQLQALAQGMPTINFAGELSKSDLWQALAQASIFLLTSREEGFSNTVPEAMYLQDNLILTNVGENTFFKTAVTDVHLCTTDPDEIAVALEQAITQYSTTGSEANRIFVRQHLNWTTNLNRLATVLPVQ